jgi:hypothetical protein
MSQYNQSELRGGPVVPGRTSHVTHGPLFNTGDIVALVVVAIMNLGPLAMAAFWAPFH